MFNNNCPFEAGSSFVTKTDDRTVEFRFYNFRTDSLKIETQSVSKSTKLIPTKLVKRFDMERKLLVSIYESVDFGNNWNIPTSLTSFRDFTRYLRFVKQYIEECYTNLSKTRYEMLLQRCIDMLTEVEHELESMEADSTYGNDSRKLFLYIDSFRYELIRVLKQL